jgi:hypothetical protein
VKTKVIVASLLCMVMPSPPAFAAARHESSDRDLARTLTVQTRSAPSHASEAVSVAMPFSSLQLSPALVEYLGLTQPQVKVIQKLMDQERPTTEPLMLELQIINGEIVQNNENERAAQKLVATEARLLKQLMRSNSLLQERINDVLDPRQRKRLDYLRRTSEVTVGEQN